MSDDALTVEKSCAHVHKSDSAITWLLVAGGWYLAYRSLPAVSAWLAYRALGLGEGTSLGAAVEFFWFEVPKVLLLLTAVVFGVGLVRASFSPERTRALLAGRRELTGNVLAALLGVVTPFCSCSAVPLFLGFVQAGVPLGVTFSFLIAAPMVNEVALILLVGLVGWEPAALYLVCGLGLAVVAGWVIGRLKLEGWLEPWVREIEQREVTVSGERPTWRDRVAFGREAVVEIVGRVWLYVLVGIAVGAGIHGWVPEGLLAGFMGREAWYAVPLAVLLGVPMYSNAAGIVPVVGALLDKGAALGTTLAFMMAVIALSLPEAVILRRVLTPRLLAVFFGTVACGILLIGWLFNALLG